MREYIILTIMVSLVGASVIVPHNPTWILDSLGRNVTIYHYPPEKVVALTPALSETVCFINCTKLVATVKPVTWPPELVKSVKERKVAVVGSFWMPDIEKIAQIKPDLILADEGSDLRMINKLNELGIPIVFVKGDLCPTVNCVAHDFTVVGKALGNSKKAETLVKWLEGNLTQAYKEASKFNKVKVLMLFYPFTWGFYSVGNNTYINDFVQRLNAINLIKINGWPKVAKEVLLTLKPDVLILLGGEKINSVKVIKDALAQGLQAKWICVISGWDADVIERPGPRITQAPWILLNVLHMHKSDGHGLYCYLVHSRSG